jgi:hypothetical protein
MELFLIIKYMTIISFSAITLILLVSLFVFIAKKEKKAARNVFYENLSERPNNNVKTNIHINKTNQSELFSAIKSHQPTERLKQLRNFKIIKVL